MQTIIDTNHLPTTLRRLIGCIGLELTIKFCQKYSGMAIYIPKTDNSKLLDLLGKEAFDRLCEEFGHQYTVSIPKLDKISKQQRNKEISRLKLSGVPIRRISEMFNLSPRQIIRISTETI